jgi:hypothetical protein
LQAGLEGASNSDIERVVEIARNAHDATIRVEVRANLDKICPPKMDGELFPRELARRLTAGGTNCANYAALLQGFG